jgi:transposase-like protein
MKAEEFLSDDFLKQFKNGKQLNDFLDQIQKRAIENTLPDRVDGRIVFKVRENSKVVDKTIYIAVGLRKDGYQEVFGIWLGKNESAAYWMSVLTVMKARGVGDILITATDNLNGFTQRPSEPYFRNLPLKSVLFIKSAIIAVLWSGKTKRSSPCI